MKKVSRLKQLYDARVPEGVTQKEFGLQYGIGSQSMVAQYLSETRPLNYEAAAKFAKGLRCTIYDISPEMAESLQLEILPFLGKALRRAAMYAALAVLPALSPSPSEAAQSQVPDFFKVSRNCVLCIVRRLLCAIAHIVRFHTPLHNIGGIAKHACS